MHDVDVYRCQYATRVPISLRRGILTFIFLQFDFSTLGKYNKCRVQLSHFD